MILMIDNYDSFTYNLVHLTGTCIIENDIKICVMRNDEVTVSEIEQLNPSHIIISPGPGYPKDAGVSKEVIRTFYKKIPILGVCLGHQAICEVFGGTITHSEQLIHGKKKEIEIDTNIPIFQGLEGKINAGRYHSLIATEHTFPKELNIISRCCDNGEIMAVKHELYPLYGVQFHPESILTPNGPELMTNFLNIKGAGND